MPIPSPRTACCFRATAVRALVVFAALTAATAVPRATAAQPARPPLRVLRVTPADSAGPGGVVTVVFDRAPRVRPLGAAVTLRAPSGVAVAARAEWVDPLTLRLVPLAPLAAGPGYAVSVAPQLTAVDGGRLAGPTRSTFVVRPPRLVASDPPLATTGATVLAADARVRLLYDGPLDRATLARGARLTFTPQGQAAAGDSCAAHAPVPFVAAAARPVRTDDPYQFESYRASPQFAGRDSLRPDRFRRVVKFTPAAAVAEGCPAVLTIFADPSTDRSGTPVRYPVHTAPPFELVELRHVDGVDSTLIVSFTAPVREDELRAHLHLEPDRAFTVSSPYGNSAQSSWAVRAAFPARTAVRLVLDSTMRDDAGRHIAAAARSAVVTVPNRLPRVGYDLGLVTVDRARGSAARLILRVRHLNVARAEVMVWAIPDSLRPHAVNLATPTPAALAAIGVTDSVRMEVRLTAPLDTERISAVPLSVPRQAAALWAVRVRVLEPAPGLQGDAAVPPSTVQGRAPTRPTPTRFDGLEPPPEHQHLALVQAGDLAVHAKGSGDGVAAFVTRRSDGAPVGGARVTLYDTTGAVRATGVSASDGLVALVAAPASPTARPATPDRRTEDGDAYQYRPSAMPVVEATVGATARIVQPLGSANGWHPNNHQLSVYELGGSGGNGVRPRGVLYTDRDFYRPGERVHFAAVAREGLLGALRPPPPGDSARLTVRRSGAVVEDGDVAAVRDTVLHPDTFGTVTDSLRIAPGASLDEYVAQLALWRDGGWQQVAAATYRVAEYRAPEFLVDVALDSTPRLLGDTVHARVDARLLFDAPMPGATLRWRSMLAESDGVSLPGLPVGWSVGGRDWSAFGLPGSESGPRNESRDGQLTLDRGPARVIVPTTRGLFTRPATLQLHTAVTDLNRQTVTRTASVTVHPSRVYLAARDSADAWTWRVGVPRSVRVLALRPSGERVGNVRVRVAVLAARWQHDVGNVYHGRWVVDTLARDTLVIPALTGVGAPGDTSAAAILHVVPPRAGAVAVVLRADDEEGRPATTVLTAWAIGAADATAWWRDDQPVRLPLLTTRPRLVAGDTAELRYTSPFRAATAWVTVERERVLRSWAVPVGQGPQVVRVPVSAADAPNVYVGVTLIPRGISHGGADTAPVRGGDVTPMRIPGDTSPIPLERRLRAGYASLDIAPEAQRLVLSIAPQRTQYAPGDTARIAVRTTDARGHGLPASVALWAVDEGVLALGDYTRPAPLAQLYTHEGIGWTLGSTLTRLGLRLPPWVERQSSVVALDATAAGSSVRSERRMRRTGMQQEADFSGAEDSRPLPAPPPRMDGDEPQTPAAAARKEFRSTAFFLGGVRTDVGGVAEARPVLPDNLTRFRVVAVAASAGDAYGGADTTLVATKPITIRAALPRFVRSGDSLVAGATATWRDTTRGGARLSVRVTTAGAGGIALRDAPRRDTSLAAGGSAELRWTWRVPTDGGPTEDGPGARFVFSATATRGSDAVRASIPVRPAYVPRTYALTGTLAGGAAAFDTVRLALPAGLDLGRSRVQLSAGPTPAPAVRAAAAQLLAYPYDCTEQLTSLGRALVAVLRVASPAVASPVIVPPGPRDGAETSDRLQAVVDALVRRQRQDGAFGYWSDESWSTAWLNAEVGRLLLDARAAGVHVEGGVVPRLQQSLVDSVARPLPPRDSLFGTLAERRTQSARALAGRLGALAFLRQVGAADTTAEGALIRRANELAWEDRASLVTLLAARGDSAHAGALLDTLWRGVGRAGARAELADSLLRTAADFPSHVRPATRLLLATRALRPAHPRLGELAAFLQQRGASERGRRWWAWNTQDLAAAAEGLAAVAEPAAAATAPERGVEPPLPLTGRVTRVNGGDVLAVRVPRRAGAGPTFYALTVTAVPLATGPRVRAAREDSGLVVERWVEPLDAGRPVSGRGPLDAGAHPPRVVGDVAAGALVRVYLRVTAPADREFVALEDPLPAGLEAVDLSLRTSGTLAPFVRGSGAARPSADGNLSDDAGAAPTPRWGWWSPWEHTEQRDDAVRWYARRLARGSYTVSYVARATTAGQFVRVPAHAEEMYNPALAGRTEGGTLRVRDGAERLAAAPR